MRRNRLRVQPSRTCHLTQPSLHHAALQPGFYAARMESGVITAAAACPPAYWCPGGRPISPFDPARLAERSTADATIRSCPDGTQAQEAGATAVQQCCKCLRRCHVTWHDKEISHQACTQHVASSCGVSRHLRSVCWHCCQSCMACRARDKEPCWRLHACSVSTRL